MRVYVIGSLRNILVIEVASRLRTAGHDVFDDWMAAGPEADDYWMHYEQAKGHTFADALKGAAARNVFHFDKRYLDVAEAVVLVLPAGKSGHLELGYSLGRKTPGFILLDKEPDRFDVMYQFATAVVSDVEDLVVQLGRYISREETFDEALRRVQVSESISRSPTAGQAASSRPCDYSRLDYRNSGITSSRDEGPARGDGRGSVDILSRPTVDLQGSLGRVWDRGSATNPNPSSEGGARLD